MVPNRATHHIPYLKACAVKNYERSLRAAARVTKVEIGG